MEWSGQLYKLLLEAKQMFLAGNLFCLPSLRVLVAVMLLASGITLVLF